MEEWNGVGIPPAAQRRIDEAASSKLASSLLTVTSHVGIGSVGYEPVSEVMGSVVLSTRGAVLPPCGVSQFGMGMSMGMGMSQGGPMGGGGMFGGQYEPYVDVINRGWTIAMERMMLESEAVSAHGVVGIRLTQRPFEEGAYEFMVMGTAVRSSVGHDHRGRSIFTTHLDGQDTSKLIQHGWTPSRLIVRINLGVRHDDYQTINASGMFSQNVEIPGYTQLMTRARAEARQGLLAHLARGKEAGVIVDSLEARIFGSGAQGHTDHYCEVRIIGTSIVPSGAREERVQGLPILYLSDKGE